MFVERDHGRNDNRHAPFSEALTHASRPLHSPTDSESVREDISVLSTCRIRMIDSFRELRRLVRPRPCLRHLRQLENASWG